ncbi:MAG: TIGR03663 family protein [Chloroflexi bacterium]|nr:TIGR03663 family protein [Chloroflexota bacterium]
MSVQVQEQKQSSLWDTPITALVKINWDVVILVALLVVAAVTRFYDLGSAAWSHDEAIHTHWSNDLYMGHGYIHNPVYHGPLLYHLTALAFFVLGDNDFSARAMPVLFGLVMIALPFFFRGWLGKRGWVVTSVLLFISPVVAHYARVDRHDIYVEVFVILMALAIMKYLTTRRANWLYFASAVLALGFTAMETTFIFMALFGYFLAGVFTYDWFNKRAPGAKWSNAALAAVFGLPFALVAIVMFLIEKYRVDASEERDASKNALDVPAFDLLLVLGTFIAPMGLTPLFIKYGFALINSLLQTNLSADPTNYASISSISAGGFVLVLFIALSAAVGLLWNWRKWLLCAVWFYPIMLIFFTTFFTNPAGIGSGFVGSLGYWISQQSVQRGGQPQYYYLLVTMPMYEYLPYLFGGIGLLYILVRRSWKRAAVYGIVLLALAALEAYIWFTPGIVQPVPGAPDQTWLLQGFPFFSGKDSLQASNFTVLLLGFLMPLFFALAYDPDDESTRFPTLLGVWAIGVLVLFSWAGEKMPWLTMHLAIPLAFVAGYFMDDVLHADWRALVKQGALWMAIVFALGLLVLAFQFFFGPAPLAGTPLDEFAARASTIVAILIIGACAGIVVYLGMSLGLKNALRVLAVTLFVILAVFTVRTMASAAYYNKDMATEVIVYAQGTPDVPAAMNEIEELSRRLCAQTQTDAKLKLNCDNGKIKVAYDDDSSWPFVWYFRDYPNAQFYGKKPGGPFDAEVVIIGDANEGEVKPFLGNRYVKRQMRLVWWPAEDYKGLTWTKLLGGTDESGNPVQGFLQPENFKKIVRDIWFFRKYGYNLSSWPFVHRFSLYVRKDVANQLWQYAGVVPPTAVENDPYTVKFIADLQAQATVMGADGAFDGPKNMALASDGSLYVLDTNNHRVEKFDATRKFVKAWGAQGNAPGQFNEPWGIAVAPDGTVYVADTWNHRIEKFDQDGNFISAWGVFGDVGEAYDQNLLQLYGPRAIAIDKEGNLWVADTGNERIIEYSSQGEPLDVYGGTGAAVGQFLEPVGIAIGADGNFYVADTWNRRIQVFDASFEPLQQIDIEAWDSQSVVNKPYIAVDAEGNLYVTDPEGYRVIKFGKDGQVRAVWGIPGSSLTSMQLPTGIALDAQGNLYIADAGNNRVLIFDAVRQ